MTKRGVSIQREGILSWTNRSRLRSINALGRSKHRNTRYFGAVPISVRLQFADTSLLRVYRRDLERSSWITSMKLAKQMADKEQRLKGTLIESRLRHLVWPEWKHNKGSNVLTASSAESQATALVTSKDTSSYLPLGHEPSRATSCRDGLSESAEIAPRACAVTSSI